MRYATVLLFLSCSLPTIDNLSLADQTQPTQLDHFESDWHSNLSGNWILISSTEDNPPEQLLSLRVYNPETKFFECDALVASIANLHEIQFFQFVDLCFVSDTTISSRPFPYTQEYYVDGNFSLHKTPKNSTCFAHPTGVDCQVQDDYYILTLDLYESGSLTKQRIYRKALPAEEHTHTHHTYVTVYDEQQIPYEFFLDSRAESNFIAQFCPSSLRALIHVDSTYADRVPFEIACVSPDNSFTACPYENKSDCIFGTFADGLVEISYDTPDGKHHILTQ